MKRKVFVLLALVALIGVGGGMLISCDSSPESFDSTGQWFAVISYNPKDEGRRILFDINSKYPGRFFYLEESQGFVEIDNEKLEIKIFTDEKEFIKELIPYEKSKDGDLTVITVLDGGMIKYKVINNDQIECTLYDDNGDVIDLPVITMNRIKNPYTYSFVGEKPAPAA